MRYCFGSVSSHSVIGLKNPQVRQPIFTRIFKVFTKLPDRVEQRRGQFVKTLKIQVKFILNSTRTQRDYLFITQRAKFLENFPRTLKHNQPVSQRIWSPPRIWTPRSRSASGFGPPGPNPLADMDPLSRIWTP